jgi:hypothetical protein
VCGLAHADPLIQKLRGEYTAKSPLPMSLRTIILGEENSAFAAEIIVGDKSCSGAMSGVGKSDGKVLKFKPYPSSESNGGKCEVTITLDKAGTAASISESACSDYHGAQCLFEGALRAK